MPRLVHRRELPFVDETKQSVRPDVDAQIAHTTSDADATNVAARTTVTGRRRSV
jgi:hypothetical protein